MNRDDFPHRPARGKHWNPNSVKASDITDAGNPEPVKKLFAAQTIEISSASVTQLCSG
jgi:hypothetical protein